MTLIVTGGVGFIGKHFTEWALKSGHRVYCIDKLTYASRGKETEEYLSYIQETFKETFKFVQEDICSIDYIPDADFLINFAAATHVDNSIQNQSSFIQTNICGTENLLQLVRAKSKFNRPVFIQISTDETFGDEPPENGFDELNSLNPSSPYSASKAAADMLVMGYGKTFGLQYNILKPTNNYSIYQFPEKLISKNLRHLDRGEKVILYGDGSFKRYWLHCDDTVRAIQRVMERGKRNEIYNISGDIIKPNREVLRSLVAAYHNRPDLTITEMMRDYVTVVENRPAEDKIYKVNDTKIRMLGWKPKHIDFDDEILKIVEHHRDSIKNWF